PGSAHTCPRHIHFQGLHPEGSLPRPGRSFRDGAAGLNARYRMVPLVTRLCPGLVEPWTELYPCIFFCPMLKYKAHERTDYGTHQEVGNPHFSVSKDDFTITQCP